jgi:hypothetical protein
MSGWADTLPVIEMLTVNIATSSYTVVRCSSTHAHCNQALQLHRTALSKSQTLLLLCLLCVYVTDITTYRVCRNRPVQQQLRPPAKRGPFAGQRLQPFYEVCSYTLTYLLLHMLV